MGPLFCMIGVLIRRAEEKKKKRRAERHRDRQACREDVVMTREAHATTEAGTGVTLPHAKDFLQPSEAGRGMEALSRGAFRGSTVLLMP